MDELFFIGRKSELNHLNNLFHESNGGLGKVVLLDGDSGTGKTAILRQFALEANTSRSTLVAHIECSDKEGMNAYAPFRQLLIELNSQAAQEGSAGKSQVMGKLKNFIMEAGPQWLGFIPVIGSVAAAGITTMQAYAKHYGNNPEAKKLATEADIHSTFDNAFREMAKNHTLVIILDDVQWADASSISLIFSLARQIRQFPYRILLICAYRSTDLQMGRNTISPEGKNLQIAHPFLDTIRELRNYTKREIHISRNDAWFSEIHLPLFSINEVNLFIQTKFPSNTFPIVFAESLMKMSGGNVLFITEMLNSMHQQGIIYSDNNQNFHLHETRVSEIPTSVEGIIADRVSHLSDELKKVLDYASVAGESFSVQVLEQILKIDELDLLEFIEKLSKKHGLLVAKGAEQLLGVLFELYQFTNSLVHHYVYENMEGARRRALHRRIAGILKDLYGENLEKIPEVHAEYLRHSQIGQGLIDGITLKMSDSVSEMHTPSTEVTQLAASEYQMAFHNYKLMAMSECIARLNKALALINAQGSSADSDKIRFDCYHVLAKANNWLGYYNKAQEAATQMLQYAHDNIEFKILAHNRLGQEYLKLGILESAEKEHLNAQRLLALNNDKTESALTEMYLARVVFERGFYDKALPLFEHALKSFASLGNLMQEAEACVYIGNCYRYMGQYTSGIEWYEKAMAHFKSLANEQWIATCYSNIGLIHNGIGNYDTAITLFNKALEIDNKLNDRVGMANHNNNVGFALELKGLYDKALTFYLKTLEIDETVNNRLPMTTTLNNIGNIYRLKGMYSESVDWHKRALDINIELNNLPGISASYNSLGNTAYSNDDLDEAMRYFTLGVEIDEQLGDKMGLSASYVNLGNVAYSRDALEQAEEYYLKALKIIKENNDTLSEGVIYTNLGNVNLMKNEIKESLLFFKKAIDIYKKTDDLPSLSLAYNNLASAYSNSDDTRNAQKFYKLAIEMDTRTGDEFRMTLHTKNLADELHKTEEDDEAIQMYLRFLKLNEHSGAIKNLADVYGRIARYFYNNGHTDDAKLYYANAVEYAVQEEYLSGVGAFNYNLGNIYMDEDEGERAIEHYKMAAGAYINDENEEDAADCWYQIGMVYNDMNDKKNCINYLEKARELYIKFDKDVLAIDEIFVNLGYTGKKGGSSPKFVPPGRST